MWCVLITCWIVGSILEVAYIIAHKIIPFSEIETRYQTEQEEICLEYEDRLQDLQVFWFRYYPMCERLVMLLQ